MGKFATVDEYFASLPEPLREVCKKLEPIIDAVLPEAKKAMWHGDAVWSMGAAPGKNAVCLLKAYSAYVTFGLWRGGAISDSSGRMLPLARGMGQVKLRSTADIDVDLFREWLRQARDLEQAELSKG